MIGISTSYFAARGHSIYESVKRAYQMGFRLIELGANHNYEKNIWKTIKKIKSDFPNVIFTLHCYFPPLFKTPILSNPAEGLTKDNEKVLKAIFKTAKILEAKVISFHPGINNKFSYSGNFKEFKGFKKFKSAKKISKEEAVNGVFEFFGKTLRLGEKYQVPVAIENIYVPTGEETTLTSLQDFSLILNKFPELFFLFDYGHATLLTKSPNKFFKFGKKIIEIHLHDVSQNLDHRILGTGKVNLPILFSEIKKLKIRPYLVLEHSGEPEEKEILEEKKLVERLIKG